MRHAFFHFFFVLLGFALACLAAAAVISLVAQLPFNSSNPYYWDEVLLGGSQIPGKLLFAAYAVAIYALPGWLISVVIAEIGKEKRWQSFVLAGVFTAIFALYYANMAREIKSMSVLFFGIIASGLVGGLVYWTVAGRHSADWRQARVNGPDQGGSSDI